MLVVVINPHRSRNSCKENIKKDIEYQTLKEYEKKKI